MFSMIITDYRTISQSINLIDNFSKKCDSLVHYFIVDNSNQHDGFNYLCDNKIAFEYSEIFGKKLYKFNSVDDIVVHLIDANENGGYAKGNNIGAKVSRALYNDKYFIFSNNDLVFPNSIDLDLIDLLVNDNPQIGIIGVDITTPTGERQNPRDSRGFISQTILWEFNVLWFHCIFNRVLWNLSKDTSEQEVGWVSGSFLIAKSEAFFLIEGFDEHTFLYCEEMIISERMKRKNYCTYYFPDIKVEHYHKGTTTRQARKMGHDSKMYYYREYRRVPTFACKLADFCYILCEGGYYLFHDILKGQIKNNNRYNKKGR